MWLYTISCVQNAQMHVAFREDDAHQPPDGYQYSYSTFPKT